MIQKQLDKEKDDISLHPVPQLFLISIKDHRDSSKGSNIGMDNTDNMGTDMAGGGIGCSSLYLEQK